MNSSPIFFFDRNFIFLKKIFLSPGMRFWQICQRFFHRQPFNFQSEPQCLQSLVSPRKLFPWRGKKLSWQTWSFFSPDQCFLQNLEKNYSWICLIRSFDAYNTALTPLVKNCPKIPEFFAHNLKIDSNLCFFGKKIIFLKMFLWIHGLQNRQLHYNCCSILQSNNFALRVRKIQNFDFYQKFVPRNVPLDT